MSRKLYGKRAAFIDTLIDELQSGEDVFVVAASDAEAKEILRSVQSRIGKQKRLMVTVSGRPASEGRDG